MEDDPAHLHGTAHHLGHTRAHWTLPPGKQGFPILYIIIYINELLLYSI